MKVILGIESPEEISIDYIVKIEDWCDRFRGWVKDGQKLIGEAVYEVVVELPSNRQNVNIVFQYLAWHTYRSGQSTKLYAPIRFLKIPRSKLAITNPAKESDREATRPKGELNYVIATAKSIRRYIFNRYIRLHRKCFSRIARLSEESWYSLNLESVCPCVMAYLIILSRQWGVSPWHLLHMQTSHVETFLNRLWLSRKTRACEVEVAMYKLIGDFYRVWSVLRHYKDLNCWALVLNYRHEGVYTTYVAPMIFETAREYRGYIHRDALIFMENPEVALAGSIANCTCRRRHSLLVHVDPLDNYSLIRNQNIFCIFINKNSKSGLRLDL
ncbi:hypothetical protein ACIPZ8_24035 [Pseudomonas sp. NPDC089422]|uniref:hypothetical protein n=1 Tax=Pseudomonas sp. NPDC089422 TaxID=3364466 RepID=UPI003824C8FF